MVSEHATTVEGLAVWKVGACQAVVAVVTVLRWEVNIYLRRVAWLGLQLIGV